MDCRPPEDSCRAGEGHYKSLRQMVDEYIACKRPLKKKEQDWFKRLSLEEAVETAALGKNSQGRRSSHHRRRTASQLAQGKAKLIAILPRLRSCETFDQVHNLLCKTTDPIKGLGELYAYDTAHAIGARLGLRPKKVYLHAGTRKGAQVLKFSGGLPYLEPSQLPRELQRLSPSEMEDFLCIYEAALRRLRDRGTG